MSLALMHAQLSVQEAASRIEKSKRGNNHWILLCQQVDGLLVTFDDYTESLLVALRGLHIVLNQL